jgi:hemerythrin-like domain-containing protein
VFLLFRFLLDACDRMLQLLQPVGPGAKNPEVDYSLVTRMVRYVN